MRYLLYLPGIILFLLPFLSRLRAVRRAEQAERERQAQQAAAAEQRRNEAERKRAIQAEKAAKREAARAAKEAEQERKKAARLDYARQLAEYAERALQAKREAKEIERAPIILHPSEQPAEPETQSDHDAGSEPPVPVLERPAAKPMPQIKGNNAFKGHVVAFTGKLPGMTRREAIQAVQDNGGRAYEKMPVGTTLLVVGDKPGMCKMDKADEWIDQVRKITAEQFFEMLRQPLTLELDEFAAMFAA